MQLKLQQIGNSVGVILPKEELSRRGLRAGDMIEIEIPDDPFWDELKQFSRKQRKAVDKKEKLSDDDLDEWEEI